MQFVLDCSVAIAWCFVDENDAYANAILAMMPNSEAFVPQIWSLEVANTLLVAEGCGQKQLVGDLVARTLKGPATLTKPACAGYIHVSGDVPGYQLLMTTPVAERRGRITQSQSALAIALLQFLLIRVDEATYTNALSSTLALGRQEGLAAYDAAYLELALRLELPLATLDNRLADSAISCGVELVVVDGEMPSTH